MANSSFRHIMTLFLLLALNSVFAVDILYPQFPSPGQSWYDLIDLAKSNSKVKFTIVLNINNGPGSSKNALYIAGIKKLTAVPNIRILGYIDTGNGNCFSWAKASAACGSGSAPNKVSDVLAQMSSWVKFYGASNINGFYLDNFLPYYGAARKSTLAVSSVLKDYVDIYSFAKRTYPGYLVVGNPALVDPAFKGVGAKMADILTVQQAARSILVNPSDSTQASFKYFPSGYGKGLVINKIVPSVSSAKAQIVQLVALAKKWGVQHFVAVRDFGAYPIDLMGYQVSALK